MSGYPKHQTEEMVGTLCSVVEQLLVQLPFDFTTGDVMAMATHLIIDAGMVAVMEGKVSREELAEDIAGAVRHQVMAWRPEFSTLKFERGTTQ